MDWLAGQIDYLLFLTGLFFASAVMAAIVARLQQERTLAWAGIASILAALAIGAWLQMLAALIGDPTWLYVLRVAIRFASWLALFECGRRTAARYTKLRLPIWTVFAIGGASLAALANGTQLFAQAVHALVAVPGAALLLWGAAGAVAGARLHERIGILTAGVGLFANAVFAAAVYFIGDSVLHTSKLAGIPAAALQAASAVLVVIGLQIFISFSDRVVATRDDRLAAARSLSVLPILFALAAAGWLATNLLGDSTHHAQSAALIARAQTAAVSISDEVVGTVNSGPHDASSMGFQALRQRLEEIHDANPDLTYVYIMRRDYRGDIAYVAEAGPDPSAPGEVYDEATDVLRGVFTTRKAAFEGPVRDRWGTWASAFAPLIADGDGAVLGILGVDVDARSWMAGVAVSRLIGIGVTAVASMLVLFFFVTALLSDGHARKLTESESRVRAILHSAPDPIVMVDAAAGTIMDANSAFGALAGLDAGEVVGKQADLLLGDAFDARDASASGVHTVEAPGGTRTLEITRTPLRFRDESGILLFLHDITERTAAEAELRDRMALENLVRAVSSRFLASEGSDVSRHIDQALATFGTFLGVDRAFVFSLSEDMTVMTNTHEWVAVGRTGMRERQYTLSAQGYPWLVGKMRRNEFVHIPRIEDVPMDASAERELLRTRETRSMLLVPMTAGWRVSGFLGFETVTEERSWTGERIALLSVLADIFASALKRAESEEELAKLSLAVTQSPAATVITDESGTIEYVNPRFRELSGYTADELIGKNPRILKSGQVADETYADMWRALVSGSMWRGELINKRKDHSLYWVQASISPVHDAQGRTHFVGVQEDISAIKEAEAALSMAAEAANAANRAKSDFLATMSHEIRTPMNAIIGMAELLDETPLSEEQTRYVRIFRSAGESLLTLINDVLDLSKIEAGRLDLDIREFDLEQMVEETAEVLAVRAREKGIELLANVGTDVPEYVSGDPDRLRQVIVNLVGNAVKFTSHGYVLVSVTRSEDSPAGVDRLRFSVTDTGIGIPSDKLRAVFGAFTQADSSTTRRYGGTGLGLTISQRLVNLMGGEIVVTSEVGVGSTFAFEADFGHVEAGAVPAADTDLSGIRALVVDDTEANRIIERQYLESAGAVVDEVEDGTSAIDALTSDPGRWDIVLLDVRMPGMSGIDVARHVHEHISPAPAMLIVSSDSRPGDSARALEAGAHSLLMKPVRRRDLVAHVRTALDAAAGRVREPEPEPVASAGSPQAPTCDIAGDGPVRIMLVEDTEDNRMLVQAYLRSTGHAIECAEDGAQAVALFERSSERPFDLILMDMQMPVMDGYEATRTIRAMEQERGLPRTTILALTAFALPQEARSALDAGCDEYLTKPIKKATLIDAIARFTGVPHE